MAWEIVCIRIAGILGLTGCKTFCKSIHPVNPDSDIILQILMPTEAIRLPKAFCNGACEIKKKYCPFLFIESKNIHLSKITFT